MAIRTPIRHPRAEEQNRDFLTYEFSITKLNPDTGKVDVAVISGSCAYEPAQGGTPMEFQDETPTGDNVLTPVWLGALVKPKMHVKVSKGSWRRIFEIADVLPLNNTTRTLLVVTPTP